MILLITILGKIYINGNISEKENKGKVKFEKEKNVGKLDFSLFFENIILEDDIEDENQDYFHLNTSKINFSF